MADGKVVFQIEADTKGIDKGLKDTTANIQREAKKWDDAADKSAGGMESSFASAFKAISASAIAAGVAKVLIDWGKAAVQAASDLQEVQNVVDVTFGDSAKQIDAWAKQADKSFGLTETQAKQFASTIGAMLKSQGLEGDLVGMSENLAGLAADMASFYNLDFETAFQKIRSGISGETEPLKQLGVNMSVANLEAFALAQGITKSYSAMSSGEQTLLRYQYLMQATADAQGDFARTADGYANASRRVASSLETIKTKGGMILMNVIEPLTTGLADLLDKLTEEPSRTVLDDFADIDLDYEKRLAHLDQTTALVTNLVSILNEVQAKTATLSNGKKISFEELFGDLSQIQQSGGNIREYIASLGLDVDYVAQEYDVWRGAISRVTQEVPALTSVIDAQTGAINGGTQAILDNYSTWRETEENKIRWTAFYAKQRALEEKKAEMGGYELEALVDRNRFWDYYEEMREKWSPYFPDAFGDDGIIDVNKMWTSWNNYGPEDQQRYSELVADFQKYEELYNNAAQSQTEYEKQTNALAEAEQRLGEMHDALVDAYGEDPFDGQADAALNAANATSKWSDAQQTAGREALTAIKAVGDYVDAVHDATEKMVESTLKGFAVIERPTTEFEKKRDKLIEQQNELNRATKDGEKRYQELQGQIDELNKSIDQYGTKGMKEGLQSQITFMEEYISNLEKARDMGLSGELMSYLSDGSVESAEYLAQLVEHPEQAQEIDQMFMYAQELKDSLTDALTQNKLDADTVYDGLVEKANESIAALNLGDEAADAMGQTVAGIARGINENVDGVSEAVDAVLAQLERLNLNYGINIGLGDFGSINFKLDGEHETGLDYVPFDGYLAGLHEGEGILTAEENRVWQRFKNGTSPQSVDYDALGGVMRDNIGGNVYLDGRVVGSVISEQQGNSYRRLQRSGWQG